MSAAPKIPFTMVGSEDAAVCVDGVCEVPPAHEESLTDQAPNTRAPNTQAPNTQG